MNDHRPQSQGLQSPGATPLGALEGPRGWSTGRIAVQCAGLLIGIALFAWAVSLALSDANQASWDAIRSAEARVVAAMIGLSLFSLVLNGLMFWCTLLPLRRLAPLEVVGVNAIATFLSLLPFKVGLATRVLIHHRRDGVRFREIVSWIAAMGALALAVLLPLTAAGLWRRDLDILWAVGAGGGILACNVAGVALGRLAEARPWLARLSLGSWRIVRLPATVIAHLALRLLDVAVLAGRFLVAAAIAGVTLPPDQAVLIATMYFLLSVLAPAGTLGFREGGVAGLAILLGYDESSIVLIALIVSAAEIAAAGALALPAAVVLRPDRLLRAPAGAAVAS